MKILIKNVLLDEQRVDILTDGSLIAKIAAANSVEAQPDMQLIDGSKLAAFAPLVNMHTHSAMSLFRGYGDDLPLEQWLNEKIWPNEAHLNPEIVYWGSKLACLEMIKSGTAVFNDMYFYYEETARAVEETGMRAMLSITGFDHFENGLAQKMKADFSAFADMAARWPGNSKVQWALAPHAVYTVSGDTLRWIGQLAQEAGMKVHIHASETQTECANSLKQFGHTPIRWLAQQQLLQSNLIVAHGLWLDDEEVALLGGCGATVVHNPNSNLKLGSGHAFRYRELVEAGANVTLGTDGCSSSNNLDMIEAMKVMSLLQKGWRHEPTAMPAQESLKVASANGYKALGLDGGVIAEGKLADLMLVDLDNIAMVPCNNALSNLAYAAHGDAVDTMICDGKVVMLHRHVEGEEETIREARKAAKKLITI